MTRRGMTILEVLLALSLLAAMAGAVATWTRVAADVSGERADDLRWERAAARAFVCIADDLAAGDAAAGDRSSDWAAGTALINTTWRGGVLEVRTRDRGPAVVRYRLDGFQLVRQRANDSPRVLLGGVEAFEVAIDRARGWMTVQLASTGRASDARRFRISSEVRP